MKRVVKTCVRNFVWCFILGFVCSSLFLDSTLATKAGICYKVSCGCDGVNGGAAGNVNCPDGVECWTTEREAFGVVIGDGCNGHNWAEVDSNIEGSENATVHSIYRTQICQTCHKERHIFKETENHHFVTSDWIAVGEDSDGEVCQYKYQYCDKCCYNVFNSHNKEYKMYVKSANPTATETKYKDPWNRDYVTNKDTKHNYKTTKFEEPTCEEDGVEVQECRDCGYVKRTKLPAPGHEYERHQLSIDNNKNACYKIWDECERCGKKIHEETVPHKFTKPGPIRTKLTCTQNETRWKVCIECGYQSDTKYETTENARGHDWVWRVDSDLSCTSNYDGHKECTNSLHNTSVDGAKTTAKHSTLFVSAPKHNYTKFVCDTPATCTKPGSGHYECTNEINGKVCGAKKTGTVPIPATGHHMTNDKVTDKPSVYTNGTRTYYCEYCKQAVTTRDVLHRNFNIYLGGKRVTMITKGDKIVWNGSYGEQGSDGGKTSTDNVNSLVESNWYYNY